MINDGFKPLSFQSITLFLLSDQYDKQQAVSSNPVFESLVLFLIGIFHHHSLRIKFENEVGRFDIKPLFNGFLTRLEWFVLYELHTMRMINKRIPRNSRFRLISF